MKALSLTQPWASLIALGHKRVETRSWSTNYRGPVLIHASASCPRWAREFAAEEREAGRLPLTQLPLGAIVATATIVGCRFTQDVEPQLSVVEVRLGDYYPGRYAWFISDVVALREPIPCRGALGLWTASNDILANIQEQLPATVAPMRKTGTR